MHRCPSNGGCRVRDLASSVASPAKWSSTSCGKAHSPRAAPRRSAPASLSAPRRRGMEVLEQPRGEGGPSGLMAGAETATILAVEVLVEQDQIPEMGIAGEAHVVPMTGPPAVGIAQEQARNPAAELAGHLAQVHQVSRPGRELDAQRVAPEVVVAFERLDQKIVEWHPDRTTP